jgi:hypothetical protein
MVEMKKRSFVIVLIILAFAVIGTVLSTLYTSEYRDFVVHNISYGLPISWHGHELVGGPAYPGFVHEFYWFSLESFLLDIAFWFAISSLVVIATMKSVKMFHKRRASEKLSVINL